MANKFPIKIQELNDWADVVFNALHGQFGEDGGVQQILDKIKIPYTGSGCMASALGMNKVLSREFFKEAGLKIPRAIVVKSKENPEETAMKIFQKMHPFWVVKPASSGSSIGVSIVKNFHDLAPAIKRAFDFSDETIVEEYIKGREATCGILENFRGEEHYALPVIEIVPPSHRSFLITNANTTVQPKKFVPLILIFRQKEKLKMSPEWRTGLWAARHIQERI